MKSSLYRIIFEADTPAGKAFDLALLVAILMSTALVCIESISSIKADWNWQLKTGEWILTGLFSIEYGLRVYCSPRRKEYLFSFFGIIDLLSILPAYLALLIGPESYYLVTIRLLRLLRVFRVLKLLELSGEAQIILRALRQSLPKIAIFFYALLILVFIEGTIMYLIEGGTNPGFNSIPQSVYWAIVTMTTVGYGDVSPITVTGKVFASFIMLTGYAIIAVPTGIVTAQLTRRSRNEDTKLVKERICEHCGLEGHTEGAKYCRRCGETLPSL
ncbi:MAG: ion transporter [Verrucomicrobiota bacterium]